MAEYEIPFTRNDLVLVLSGAYPENYVFKLCMEAAAGKQKSIENVTGRFFTGSDILQIAALPGSKIYIRVPKYFFVAWTVATGNDRFHGIKLQDWEREFIEIMVDNDELMKSGRGVDSHSLPSA